MNCSSCPVVPPEDPDLLSPRSRSRRCRTPPRRPLGDRDRASPGSAPALALALANASFIFFSARCAAPPRRSAISTARTCNTKPKSSSCKMQQCPSLFADVCVGVCGPTVSDSTSSPPRNHQSSHRKNYIEHLSHRKTSVYNLTRLT